MNLYGGNKTGYLKEKIIKPIVNIIGSKIVYYMASTGYKTNACMNNRGKK